MRLDDTNPSKESEEYVTSILEDVRWIQRGLEGFGGDNDGSGQQKKGENAGPWYGNVRKTSDYFELIYDAAVMLIKRGEAYVDELTADEMREYRGTLTEGGKESPWRERSIEENLKLFEGVSSRAVSIICHSDAHFHLRGFNGISQLSGFLNDR